MGGFIRSNEKFPCPKCGIKVYVFYADPARLMGKWGAHSNDDGRCKQSDKKVLNTRYLRK